MGNHALGRHGLLRALSLVVVAVLCGVPFASSLAKPPEASCDKKAKSQAKAKTGPPSKKTAKLSKVKESTPRKIHGTFVHEMSYAPYPYRGKFGDTKIDFFDYVDSQTRERFHTNAYGDRLPEWLHYRDRSVVLHIPPHFNPRKPFTYLVFFHGIPMNVRQCVADYHLTDQIDASGKNVILVAPQIVKNAFDSSPGKFFRKGAFRTFMREVAEVLSHQLGKKHLKRLQDAPIILAPFSGGYKAVAYILDRGAVDSRIQGIFLLDALYDEVGRFEKWIRRNARRTFFIHIYTEGSCAENSMILAEALHRHRFNCRTEWPKRISKGDIYFIRSHAGHMKVPVEGPPMEPLTHLLRTLR